MVSTEAKISHTRKDIKALDKDIKGLYHDIAKEEVRCEDLENEVSTKREALSTSDFAHASFEQPFEDISFSALHSNQ